MPNKNFLDKIKPYNKHNLYVEKYRVNEDGIVLGIPNNAHWIALTYVGYRDEYGIFRRWIGDIVTLILEDNDNNFWPVISFLTNREARELAED